MRVLISFAVGHEHGPELVRALFALLLDLRGVIVGLIDVAVDDCSRRVVHQ